MHSCRSPGKLGRPVESYLRGLDLNTPNAQELINWSCKLTLYQRERDGGGGQPPVKSEVRAQSNKVGRLWFFGGRCSRISRETPKARSRLCVCRAPFLMTFVTSGMFLASSRQFYLFWVFSHFRIFAWAICDSDHGRSHGVSQFCVWGSQFYIRGRSQCVHHFRHLQICL
jgi:hypothetical protein